MVCVALAVMLAVELPLGVRESVPEELPVGDAVCEHVALDDLDVVVEGLVVLVGDGDGVRDGACVCVCVGDGDMVRVGVGVALSDADTVGEGLGLPEPVDVGEAEGVGD